jgi:hypothetical protein
MPRNEKIWNILAANVKLCSKYDIRIFSGRFMCLVDSTFTASRSHICVCLKFVLYGYIAL